MDAYSLDPIDLGMLCAAVDPHCKLFVSIVFAAIVEQHGLHLHIERDGHDFALVSIETVGDVVAAERRLPVVWDRLDEAVRLYILRIHLDGLLAGHERWLRRIAPRLATLGVAPFPAND